MSKLADRLREIKVFNNWELLKQFGASGDVAIEYSRPADGRIGWTDTHHTTVWSPLSHPKLPCDRLKPPQKRFIGKRAETFQLAINWAMGEFGHDYVPSPFGGRVPDHVLQKARNALTVDKGE